MSLFEIKNISGIDFCSIPDWNSVGIIQGTSFRNGGVSKNEYASLNMGLGTDDDKSNILENRKRFFSIFNINSTEIITLNQIHSDRIIIVSNQDKGRSDSVSSADGLITNDSGIPLCIFTADCVPLFFAELQNKVIGIAHAGWRGTVNGIARNIIEMMKNIFGAEPENILVGIGPGISPCCYEVGDDIFELFSDSCRKITNNKKFVDLKKANKIILLESGCKEENITIMDFCTCCRKDLAYSARASGTNKTGRMCSFILQQ